MMKSFINRQTNRNGAGCPIKGIVLSRGLFICLLIAMTNKSNHKIWRNGSDN